MNEESKYPENMTLEELEFWKKAYVACVSRPDAGWEKPSKLLRDAKLAVEALREAQATMSTQLTWRDWRDWVKGS
jgi:hypothetical protein